MKNFSMKTRLVLFLGIIGIVLVVKSVPDWLVMRKPAIDITDLWDTDLSKMVPGQHVSLDVTLVWEQIGTRVEQSKTMGVTTSEKVSGYRQKKPWIWMSFAVVQCSRGWNII